MDEAMKKHIEDQRRIGFAQGVMMRILWTVEELTEHQKSELQDAIDGLNGIGADDDQ